MFEGQDTNFILNRGGGGGSIIQKQDILFPLGANILVIYHYRYSIYRSIDIPYLVYVVIITSYT